MKKPLYVEKLRKDKIGSRVPVKCSCCGYVYRAVYGEYPNICQNPSCRIPLRWDTYQFVDDAMAVAVRQ